MVIKDQPKSFVLSKNYTEIFFVTLENDFDFLVRTIFLQAVDLLSSEKLIVPFDSSLEHKINKISISSKLVFKTYGLKIIHD
jgi:hypothetical protein